MKHGQQLRHSGDPYFAHPVAVAGLLTDLKMDQSTIIAGLLHDVVEDMRRLGRRNPRTCSARTSPIWSMASPSCRRSRAAICPRALIQAENFQKFILATTKDIRVLLVKLADRLHNMRTIEFMPTEESRLRISRETLDIYAPLARRVGLSIFAAELEDLAFRQVNPVAYAAITKRLEELVEDDTSMLDRIRSDLDTVMLARGVRGELAGPDEAARIRSGGSSRPSRSRSRISATCSPIA